VPWLNARAAWLLAISLALAAAPAARAHEGMGDEKEGEHSMETPEQKAEAKKHEGSPRSFESKPALGTWATCPVSGETFQIDEDTLFSTYKGRTYAFCCPGCKGDFKKHPARFARAPASKT